MQAHLVESSVDKITKPLIQDILVDPVRNIETGSIIVFAPPSGYTFLVDDDGNYIVDDDGYFLVEPIDG